MKTMMLVAATLLAIPVVSHARRSEVRDARDSIERAAEEARDEGGRCKRKVARELDDIEDALRDDPSSREVRRIRKDIEDVFDDAERACGRRVRKAIERSLDDLEGDRDRDDRSDRRDRRERRRRDRDDPPKVELPTGRTSAHCRTLFMVNWIMKIDGSASGDQGSMRATRDQACADNSEISGTSYWQNGRMAWSSGGTYYYPSGRMARSNGGTLYYPSGRMAKSNGGTWYYPDGRMAKSNGGSWYYPSGSMAGDKGTVKSWACGRTKECKGLGDYFTSRDADVADFIVVALGHTNR